MSSSIETEKTWTRASPTPTGIHSVPRWRIAPHEYTTRGTYPSCKAPVGCSSGVVEADVEVSDEA